MAVEFHDFTIKVKDVIDDEINVVLEEDINSYQGEKIRMRRST